MDVDKISFLSLLKGHFSSLVILAAPFVILLAYFCWRFEKRLEVVSLDLSEDKLHLKKKYVSALLTVGIFSVTLFFVLFKWVIALKTNVPLNVCFILMFFLLLGVCSLGVGFWHSFTLFLKSNQSRRYGSIILFVASIFSLLLAWYALRSKFLKVPVPNVEIGFYYPMGLLILIILSCGMIGSSICMFFESFKKNTKSA